MAVRVCKMASFLLVGAPLIVAGCQGCENGPSASDAAPAAADSALISATVDSGSASDAPVLSSKPIAPIVDNPDTEATGNESIGHCDVRDSDNLCIDFTGSAWGPENAKAECGNAPGSSFRNETCPTGNRIGTCVIHPNGNASLELVHSFFEPMDPILAEAICPGRFEAG